MNILYIHQYFKTPQEGGCVRSYHLAKGLVEKGHQVTMITTQNAENDITKEIEGITVHYLAIPYDNSFSFIKRIIAFIRFFRKAIKKSNSIKDVDYAYVMTTPLSTGMVALWLKRFKNIPYAFEIGDLWPEVPIRMGILKNPLIKSFSKWLEKSSYKNADKLVALSPEIKDHVEQIVPAKPVFVIPNFCDNQLFEPNYIESTSKLRVLYCGTVGLANHLEYLVNVAKFCKEQSLAVEFTVVGAGARFEEISNLSKSLRNFQVLGFRNQHELKNLIAEHDAFYISFRNLRVLHSGSPNKFFDGLASGKLIISNLDGWTREVIESTNSGFYYNPDDPSEFIDKIQPYLNSSEMLLRAQKHSRSIAEKFFDKNKMIELQNDILTGATPKDSFELPQ